MSEVKTSTIIKIPMGRLAFANLFEPVAIKGAVGADAAKKRYGCTIIIAPDNPAVPLIEARIKELATEKWKGNAVPMLKGLIAKGNVAFSKSEKLSSKGEVYDGFEGMYWVSANRGEKQGMPDVYDLDKSKIEKAGRRPYNGCYVNAWVDLWADTRFEPRIVATLVGVQFRKDGDAFAGGAARLDVDDLDDVNDFGEAGDEADPFEV